MAAHSSTLAWEIPWTEKPGRLQSVHGVTKSQNTTQWLNNKSSPQKKNFLRTSCFLKDIKSPFNFWSQYPFGWMPDNQDFTILCYLNSHFSVNTFNGKQFVLCINNETTKGENRKPHIITSFVQQVLNHHVFSVLDLAVMN